MVSPESKLSRTSLEVYALQVYALIGQKKGDPMASPIRLTTQQWDNLKRITNALLTNYEYLAQHNDGIVTIQHRKELKRAYVHWYELVHDNLLPALARKEAEKKHSAWEMVYLNYIRVLFRDRTIPGIGKHPVDFLTENYLKVMADASTNSPTDTGVGE